MPATFGVSSSGLPDGPVIIEVPANVCAGDPFVVTIRFSTFSRHTTTVQMRCSPPDAVQTREFRTQHGGICVWPLWFTLPIGESCCLVPLRATRLSPMRPLPCEVTFYVAEETADFGDTATWRAQTTLRIEL